ncbi:MAG: hypothetical protein E6K18_02360 [Methanobacteriota archaeon]|nr:MAG: hypothetical protein E6K18_02360 [Euryarchaeota archaeon]
MKSRAARAESPAKLVASLRTGDKRAAARLISLIEDDEPEAREVLRHIYRQSGRAHIVGLTGPPGTGKSTLISRLLQEFRKRGRKSGWRTRPSTRTCSSGAWRRAATRAGSPSRRSTRSASSRRSAWTSCSSKRSARARARSRSRSARTRRSSSRCPRAGTRSRS